ncbi:MAG TPA: thioredoxin family protein [Thermoanaerobaculia bacterium]
MKPLADEIWNRGLPYGVYRAGIARNQETFDEVYASPSYRPEELEMLRGLPPLRVLAIGEDWCPDVFHTLPTWARVAEELPGWELRVFARDSHPDVMEPFLWKEERAKRIPVYAFYDGEGWLQAWWSGRGAEAERALHELLAGRSYAQLDKEEQKRIGQLFEESYRREHRRKNFEEILALLRAFFHLG